MNSFIEYLLRKEWIKAEHLLLAILEQAKTSPSIPELLHNNRWMSPEAIVSALLIQEREGLSFKGACQKAGTWTQDIEQKVQVISQRASRPLTQILLEKGYLKTSSLNEALLAFQNQKTTEPEQSDVLSLEVLKTLGGLAEKLEKNSSLQTDDQVRALLVDSLYCLHSLRGMARFADLAPIERLLADAEAAVQAAMNSASVSEKLRGLAQRLGKVTSLINRALPQFEKLRALSEPASVSKRVIPTDDPLWGNGSPSLQ